MHNESETPRNAPDLPPVSRRFIVASRLLLLLFAVSAATAAALIALRDPAAAVSGVRYVCPMHPEVRSGAAGQCPICRMALEPTGRDVAATAGRAAAADTSAVENVRKHRIMDFVRKRALLFEVRELRGPAWVESDGTVTALFYDDQIAVIHPGERGSFTPTDAPGTAIGLRRLDEAAVRWDDSTSRIRFRLEGSGAPLAPGRVGWLELPRKPREVVAVPVSAIVNSPEGPYVLAAAGAGFEKRPIEIGETFMKQGFAVVRSGLRAQDRVVAKATFFLDADRKLDLHGDEEGRGER
jgi:hypothetical protein